MSHNMQALVFRLGMAKQAMGEIIPPRIRLTQEFEMIPHRIDFVAKLEPEFSQLPTHLSGKKPDLLFLDRDFAALACAISKFTRVAYIETDFFGGHGEQSSIVWEKGAVIQGPLTKSTEEPSYNRLKNPLSEWPINRALRLIGVKKKGKSDEFEGLGLEQHRQTES